MAAVGAEVRTAQAQPAPPRESLATRMVRVAAKAPVHIVLAVVGILWLIPTLGLFFTSIMPADKFDTTGCRSGTAGAGGSGGSGGSGGVSTGGTGGKGGTGGTGGSGGTGGKTCLPWPLNFICFG
jgi:ABC-type glycerol-3-phosphate transport system permease component